ncbi:Histidine ammonia-lyase [Trichinella spiralis]|uniref:Histidine ammonia-lyase n=1 Tax=Trichinella spiralis TaxID=6334 RepID=A0ABR3KTZ7_TRISP
MDNVLSVNQIQVQACRLVNKSNNEKFASAITGPHLNDQRPFLSPKLLNLQKPALINALKHRLTNKH